MEFIKKEKNGREHLRNLLLCSLFAAFLAVCSWISVPVLTVPFTLQTFGVFLTLCFLGGRLGTVTVLLYLTLGAIGVPVISGFRGGIGVLLGPTGGYLLGFLFSGLIYWLLTAKRSPVSGLYRLAVLTAALVGCYLFGSLWFLGYTADGTIGFWGGLMKCVVPYLLPDFLKMILASRLSDLLLRVSHR